MHRATPSDSSFRGYASGTRGGVVKSVSDSNGLQTCSSGMMKGESRDDIESPQNYGFTSVCDDAGADGKGPECQFNYSGGNGSFPIAGAMDDRRHRLLGLDKDEAKGSTGMFGLKKWGQQLLNTEKGWFMTGNTEKVIRQALVEAQQQQGGQGGSSGGGGGASARAGEGGGGSGGGDGGQGGGEQQQDGQKSLRKKNEQAKIYHHCDKDTHDMQHGENYTRADKNHCHIAASDSMKIFVDQGGCWTTHPIEIKSDPCKKKTSQGGGGAGSGATIYEGGSNARDYEPDVKRDFKPFEQGRAREIIEKCLVYEYTWERRGGVDIGLKPQELQPIFRVPVYEERGKWGDPDFRPWAIDYHKLTPVLIAALQDAYTRINALSDRVATLEARNA